MFTICNTYTARISVVIMFYSPVDCGGEGGSFETRGWWNLNPGSCAVVYGHDVNFNRFWYYHVEAADGVVWEGPFRAWVSDTAFRACIKVVSSNQHSVGFRELDVGDHENMTLNIG